MPNNIIVLIDFGDIYKSACPFFRNTSEIVEITIEGSNTLWTWR